MFNTVNVIVFNVKAKRLNIKLLRILETYKTDPGIFNLNRFRN